jgi:predicted Zn-dependent protease
MIVGIAAIAAGAGEAGMLILMGGQGVAQAQFNAFSRVQEATADQIALKLLNKTHQSPRGLLVTFQRLADDEARSAYHMDPFASDHPMGRDRVANLEGEVDASPYKDVPEDPAVEHEYEMVQAKLAGYVEPIQMVLDHYPPSDTSKVARYARAMAYSRKPDLPKALAEINSLIKDEPNNPYFYEVLGQIYVSMAKPDLGVVAYQRSVDLLPDAPQLRVGLAAAQLATERPGLAQPALANLKVSLQQEDDDSFAWYEAAQAYSQLGNEPMANLATAERYYSVGAYQQAAQFAVRARHGLTQGSPDWQRANDIVATAGPAARQQ